MISKICISHRCLNKGDGDISCVLIDDIDVMQSCIMQQAYITECRS